MISYKIVKAKFVTSDGSKAKIRPILCLTKGVGKYNLIVVAFITSKLNQDKLATDVPLNEGTQSFVESNLPLPSSIKNAQIGLYRIFSN